MKRLFLLLAITLPLLATAQSRIYKGNSTYSSDILYTVKGRVPIALLLMIIL
jgi:hypothetical protein